MQEAAKISPWLVYGLTNLATFLGLGVAWYKERKDRKKLEADVRLLLSQAKLSDAQAELTAAQTESTQIASRKNAVDIIDGLLIRIDDLEPTISDLKAKNRDLSLEIVRIPVLEQSIKLYQLQINDIKSWMDLNNIDFGKVSDEIAELKRGQAQDLEKG